MLKVKNPPQNVDGRAKGSDTTAPGIRNNKEALSPLQLGSIAPRLRGIRRRHNDKIKTTHTASFTVSTYSNLYVCPGIGATAFLMPRSCMRSTIADTFSGSP